MDRKRAETLLFLKADKGVMDLVIILPTYLSVLSSRFIHNKEGKLKLALVSMSGRWFYMTLHL